MGGILHQSGYYMGDYLYPPRISNPKGFFEDKEINRINELILENYDGLIQNGQKEISRTYSPYNPRFGHRWLSFIPFDTTITCKTQTVLNDIFYYTEKQPFAYKDPRFCFTLDVWKQYLPSETIIIAMIRNPLYTVQSVLDECKRANYLNDFYITKQIAIDLWINYYNRILKLIKEGKYKIFVIDYDKLIKKQVLNKLSELLGTSLRNDFIDISLSRSSQIDGNEISANYNIAEMLSIYNSFSNH